MHGLFPSPPPFRAPRIRTRISGADPSPGEFRLFQSVVAFGVVTLFATACLVVVQVFEDFRDA